MSRIQKAKREKVYLRLGLDGPSGAGKTFSMLRFLSSLAHYVRCAGLGPGRIGVIETERRSANLYIGEDPDGLGPWEFDVIYLDGNFSPSEYTGAMEEFAKAGYDLLGIDSLSHAWEGKDGALDLVDKKSQGGNNFTAWKDVTPLHRRMVDTMLTYPGHLIATLRSKQEYVLQANDKGKMVPVRVGTAPIQRQGMEYEFTAFASLDTNHIATFTKSRCKALDGYSAHKPGPDVVNKLADWLYTGEVQAPVAVRQRIRDEDTALVLDLISRLGWTMDRLKTELPKRYHVTELNDLSPDQGTQLVGWMRGQLRIAEKDKPPVRMPLPEPPPAPESPPDITPSAAEADAAFGLGQSADGPTQAGREPPVPEHEPIATDEQLEQLKALRSELFVLRGIADDKPAKEKLWKEILRPFKADSVGEMSVKEVDALTAEVQKRVDAAQQEKAAGGNGETPAPPAGPKKDRK